MLRRQQVGLTRSPKGLLVDSLAGWGYNTYTQTQKELKMTNIQKAAFFLFSGIVMLMGVVGGVEASPNLLSYDAVYLVVFALVGFAFMAVGTSYAQDEA